jgi:hypothetical protein
MKEWSNIEWTCSAFRPVAQRIDEPGFEAGHPWQSDALGNMWIQNDTNQILCAISKAERNRSRIMIPIKSQSFPIKSLLIKSHQITIEPHIDRFTSNLYPTKYPIKSLNPTNIH